MNDRLLIPTLLCPKAWESMSGNEATRFCSYCKKHVHNLEAMSVSERLTLLSSPGASICARYKVAIRRPAPGKKESYMRHLTKYGAGVALASSALVVLCEMYVENDKRAYYRAIAGAPRSEFVRHTGCGWLDEEWPHDTYEEFETTTLGFLMPFPRPAGITACRGDPTPTPAHVDLDLDPVEIDRLLRQIKPSAIELNPVIPPKTKKARKIPSLRRWGA